MFMNPSQPSHRCFVDDGLTTLPEYWNDEELWYGMVRSRNHAMMGHVREWMSSSLLGLRQVKPAWQETVIAPYAPEGMTFAEGSVYTPYLENGRLQPHTASSGVWTWDAPAARHAVSNDSFGADEQQQG